MLKWRNNTIWGCVCESGLITRFVIGCGKVLLLLLVLFRLVIMQDFVHFSRWNAICTIHVLLTFLSVGEVTKRKTLYPIPPAKAFHKHNKGNYENPWWWWYTQKWLQETGVCVCVYVLCMILSICWLHGRVMADNSLYFSLFLCILCLCLFRLYSWFI